MTLQVRVAPSHHRSSRKKNGHYPLYDASSSRPPLYKYSLYTPGIGLDRDTNTGSATAQPEVATLLSALQLVRLFRGSLRRAHLLLPLGSSHSCLRSPSPGTSSGHEEK